MYLNKSTLQILHFEIVIKTFVKIQLNCIIVSIYCYL